MKTIIILIAMVFASYGYQAIGKPESLERKEDSKDVGKLESIVLSEQRKKGSKDVGKLESIVLSEQRKKGSKDVGKLESIVLSEQRKKGSKDVESDKGDKSSKKIVLPDFSRIKEDVEPKSLDSDTIGEGDTENLPQKQMAKFRDLSSSGGCENLEREIENLKYELKKAHKLLEQNNEDSYGESKASKGLK